MIEFGVKSLPSVAQGGGGFPDHEPTPESGPVAHQFLLGKNCVPLREASPARTAGRPAAEGKPCRYPSI
jgi:hypothetical protein